MRELMDVVQRCMIFSESQSISVDELDLTKDESESWQISTEQKKIEGDLGELIHLLTLQPYNEARKIFENWYVRKVYEYADRNQSQTARMLGIDRNTVRRILVR